MSEMDETLGPTFITVTDEDGNDIELEFIDAVEYKGSRYLAFFPAETEDSEDENEDGEDDDTGLIILKVLVEEGEEVLSTLTDDEELDAVYDLFMESLFDDEDED
jgi:uncharacterized protein YrzB (UPF0473 family)